MVKIPDYNLMSERKEVKEMKNPFKKENESENPTQSFVNSVLLDERSWDKEKFFRDFSAD